MQTVDELVDRFCRFYQQLESASLDQLDEIYSDKVSFSDPVLSLHGLDELKAYLAHGLDGVESCRFDITTRLRQGNEVSLCWEMIMRHPGLNRGQPVTVPGMSYLRLADRIEAQRDYYDLGAMVYEHVPLLGGVVRRIKNRIGAN